MLAYPAIDPVAISIGPVRLHWYGLMYVIAFFLAWLLGRYRASRPGSGWEKEQVDDFVTWAMLGVVVGARLGYVLFYDFEAYKADPMEILRVWNGGMSFHGGLLGVIITSFFWARKQGKRFLDVMDFVAPLAPLGLLCGRIGNFINGELWGRVAEVEWAMVFPGAGDLPRHPTQLYEARTGRSAAVSYSLDLLTQTPTSGCGVRPVCHGLCPGAHFCGILPRSRSSARLSLRRLADHGADSLSASALYRTLPPLLCLASAQRSEPYPSSAPGWQRRLH